MNTTLEHPIAAGRRAESPTSRTLHQFLIDRLPYGIVFSIVVLAAVLYYRAPGSQGFPLDDGYISLHSAQVLHWATDPNFPGVPALTGITNAPYVLLIWALLFFLPPLAALHVACWAGVCCYATGLIALCRAFRLPVAATVGVTALGVTAGLVIYHLLNGVETGFAVGITAWIFALATWNTASSRKLAALLCGLAPFLRPELIGLSALVLLCMACEGVSEKNNLSQVFRRAFPLLMLTVIAAAPWAIWYWLNTGVPIPQSIEAKRVFFADGCAPPLFRWNMMTGAFATFIGAIGLLSLAFVYLVRSTLGKCALTFLFIFLVAYYERLPGALFHNWGRYNYVLIPVFLLGMVAGLGDSSRWVRRSAYVLLAVSCAQSAINFGGHWARFTSDRNQYNVALSSVAQWSVEHLPADSVLLIHDAGYMSYASHFRMVDFVGLKTPSSIEFNRRYTYGTCGMGRPQAISAIASAARPDYLVVVNDWDRIFHVTASLNAFGWGLQPVFDNRSYRVYRLSPPMPKTVGLSGAPQPQLQGSP